MGSAGRNTPAGNLKRAILALHEKLERLIPRFMILEGQENAGHFPLDRRPLPRRRRGDFRLFSTRNEAGPPENEPPELHAHEIVAVVIHYTMMTLRHRDENLLAGTPGPPPDRAAPWRFGRNPRAKKRFKKAEMMFGFLSSAARRCSAVPAARAGLRSDFLRYSPRQLEEHG